MGRVGRGGSGLTGPYPVSAVSVVPFAHVPVVVWAQALLIHEVGCRQSMRALLAAAERLRVVECTVRGVRYCCGWAGGGGSAYHCCWYTWTDLLWSVVIWCGLGVPSTQWSGMFLGGSGAMWIVGAAWGLVHCLFAFCLFLFSFLVRESGLPTSFYVTSLYIDTTPWGGPCYNSI